MTVDPITQPVIAVLRLETHWCAAGRLRSRGSFPSFLGALAREARVIAVLPVVDEGAAPAGEQDVSVDVAGLHALLRLPRCEGYLRAYLAIPYLVYALVCARWQTRVLLVRVPEHLNFVALPLASLLGFRIFCWMVADREVILDAELQRRGRTAATLGGMLLNRLTGAVERIFTRRCPVVANGRALAEKARASGARSGDVLRVQSTTLPARLPTRARDVRSDSVFEILYVGRFAPEKGIGDLLRAVKQLRDRMPLGRFNSVRLRLVGWHAHGEDVRLRDDLRHLNIEDCVEVVGPLPFGDRLFARYLESDAMVIPSWIEGTPRVLVEAMAFGVPVVATRVGGIPELVDDGVDGLLVPAKAPDAIVEALQGLAQDDSARERIAAHGQARARGQTVDALARSIKGFIEARELPSDAAPSHS